MSSIDDIVAAFAAEKIMTPAETAAANGPTVTACVREINRRLAKGELIHLVQTGIAPQIRDHFVASGWKIHREVSHDNGYTVLYLREGSRLSAPAHEQGKGG